MGRTSITKTTIKLPVSKQFRPTIFVSVCLKWVGRLVLSRLQGSLTTSTDFIGSLTTKLSVYSSQFLTQFTLLMSLQRRNAIRALCPFDLTSILNVCLVLFSLVNCSYLDVPLIFLKGWFIRSCNDINQYRRGAAPLNCEVKSHSPFHFTGCISNLCVISPIRRSDSYFRHHIPSCAILNTSLTKPNEVRIMYSYMYARIWTT